MHGRAVLALTVSMLFVVACGDGGITDAEPPPTTPTTAAPSATEPSSGPTTPEPATTPTTVPPEAAAGAGNGDTSATQLMSTTTPTTVPAETAGSAGVGDSFYPLLGNGGYDVIHYRIALDIDPATNTMDAATTITAVATQDLSSFNLDLSGLHVASVDVDGDAAFFSREGSEMTVSPPAAIPDGAEFSVTVIYSGTPQPIADPGVPFTRIGWQWMGGVIFTVNEPSGAMSWFPGNNHPTDKATFAFHITVPAGSTAAATGVLVEEVLDEGRTTATWLMNDPMATYLAAVYVGDFERRENVQPDGLLIRDYIPPDIESGLAEALSITPDIIRYYESILGPYPFEAYGTIVLPFATGFALENQTLSVHGLDTLDPYVIAHEIMHQWFGNSVTIDDWSDIWMLEGFASYIPFMYLADAHEFDLEATMMEQHAIVISQAASPPKGIEVHEMFDFDAVYRRGALALHALRLHAGDATFLDVLRAHYEGAAGHPTNTEAFLRTVEEVAGEDAVALVESWLFDTEVPEALPTGDRRV